MMTNIYVGNLSYESTEADIRTAFEKYGKVSSVRLISDQMTGRSRGFAFVSMQRLEDADEAITRLNGSSLAGRKVTVNEAQSSSSRDEGQRRTPEKNIFQLI